MKVTHILVTCVALALAACSKHADKPAVAAAPAAPPAVTVKGIDWLVTKLSKK